MQTHDEWISAWNVLPPTSPTGLDMRDAFDAEAFVEDAYLHAQWGRVLDATEPPWRFEPAPRTLGTPAPAPAASAAPPLTVAAPAPALDASAAPPQTVAAPAPAPDASDAAPRTLGERRLSDDVLPFDEANGPARPVPMHARSVANFVREMLRTQNQAAGMPLQYFSLGEVAQYFNNFIVDVDNHGPYTCSQISAMYNVPEHILRKLWTFRPGAETFCKKEVAVKFNMTVPEVTRAYAALGFKTWVL